MYVKMHLYIDIYIYRYIYIFSDLYSFDVYICIYKYIYIFVNVSQILVTCGVFLQDHVAGYDALTCLVCAILSA